MLQANTNGAASGSDTEPRSGDQLLIHAPRPGVTRVSRRAVMLVGGVAAVIGLVVLMTGFGAPKAANHAGTGEESSIRPTGPIETVRDLPKDYSFDVRQAGQAIGYGGLALPATASTRPTTGLAQDQALSEQIRQMQDLRQKMLNEQRKEQEQALDSPLVFNGTKSLAAVAVAPAPPSATTSAMSLFDRLLDSRGAASLSGIGGSGGAGENRQSSNEEFLTKGTAIEPYLSKPLLKPISKYELKAGSVIPGALVTSINTDLPGEVIGQVSENVFDSVSGNYLLIPQGSRLIGKYQSLISNGQNRALLVWHRLIYPNGNSIILDGMPGTDQAGQAGLADQVDYHLDKLAEATALSTALAYGGNLARNPRASNGRGGQDVIGDTVAQQADRVGEKIIDRELDVQPTITIRSGWPLRVMVNKDMVLEPYAP
jgi:type IV secretory pathway VirB10-like protein